MGELAVRRMSDNLPIFFILLISFSFFYFSFFTFYLLKDRLSGAVSPHGHTQTVW